MGGYGSGRDATHWIVEQCLSLSVSQFRKDGTFDKDYGCGTIQWSRRSGKWSAMFDYQCNDTGEGDMLLCYQVVGQDAPVEIKTVIPIEATRPHFGGLRYWFTCPLVVNGVPCQRRVAKLYLPPNNRYFGCRTCHRLTYRSCQESHKYDGIIGLLADELKVSPREINRIFNAEWDKSE